MLDPNENDDYKSEKTPIKDPLQRTTEVLEEILEQEENEPRELNIKKISLEVISFILNVNQGLTIYDEIEKVANTTIVKVLQYGIKKKDFLTVSSSESVDLNMLTVRDILEKLRCVCQNGCPRTLSQRFKLELEKKEKWKTRSRRKRQEKDRLTKDWKTADEVQFDAEYKQFMQMKKAEKKKKKRERKKRKQRLLEDNVSDEEEELRSVTFGSDFDGFGLDTLKYIRKSVSQILHSDDRLNTFSWFGSMGGDLGDRLRKLYITTDGTDLNQFLSIKKYAIIFVDDILDSAQKKIARRSSEEETSKDDGRRQKNDLVLTIQSFTPRNGTRLIHSFISTWKHERTWSYGIVYMSEQSDSSSDFHLYEVKWSIPTERYPIPQATVSVFFTIEVPRIIPIKCPCKVTYTFEGNNFIYEFDTVVKHEQFLLDILECKVALFKQINF